MKQNITVWKKRQTVSYITSIYIILLRIDSIAFGCSVFIFRTKEQKSISYICFWEVILTSNQGFIPAKFCFAWPMLLPNDGPLLRMINISLPHRTQFMHNMSYVKLVSVSVFVFYRCKSTALIHLTQNMDLLYPNVYISSHFKPISTVWWLSLPVTFRKSLVPISSKHK